MKMTLTIWFLLVASGIFCQGLSQNFVVKPSSSILTDPASLSAWLTSQLTTNREKTEAIFTWITNNISYQTSVSRRSGKRNKQVSFSPEQEDDNKALPPLTERIAVKVLQQKQAVCEGYARLFQSLCYHAGIPAVIITGYARADISRTENKFRSNHAWNAVYIDSAWYLLDATWASGYIAMPAGDFVKQYDSYYFLAAPEKFIRHHFPDDLRWTLLENPPAINEFKTTAFRQRSFSKYFITSWYPAGGIIEATVGDTLHLEIEMDAMRQRTDIAPDSLWDSAGLNYGPAYAYVKPGRITHSKITYQFPVNAADVQWLHLMYNNDAVLRYRLHIKKPAGDTVKK